MVFLFFLVQLDAAIVTVSGQTDDRLKTDILLEERLVFAAPKSLAPAATERP